MKSLLTGLVGVIVGFIISSIIRNEQIDWDTIGILLTAMFLILFIKLGLTLYNKRE